jgi:hypothetical protein
MDMSLIKPYKKLIDTNTTVKTLCSVTVMHGRMTPPAISRTRTRVARARVQGCPYSADRRGL